MQLNGLKKYAFPRGQNEIKIFGLGVSFKGEAKFSGKSSIGLSYDDNIIGYSDDPNRFGKLTNKMP